MKIAIVRGPSLNRWEMQTYEPLTKIHEVLCIGSVTGDYNISGIKLSIKKLWCPGHLLGKIPGSVRLIYKLIGDPRILVGLDEAVRGFDILHTAELTSFYTHQALKLKKNGAVKKVVATVWENIPFIQEKYLSSRRLKQYAVNNLDHILAVNQQAKRALLKEGFNTEKISVIPPGIDLQKYKFATKKRSKQITILSVGRLVWEKGFSDILLAATDIISDPHLKNNKIEFLFVGEGPEKNNLIRLTKRLELGNTVRFVSSVNYVDMPELYRQADIFILVSKDTPQWREQFGMVAVEAMASGVPVITTDTGAISETVGNNACIIPHGDWRRLSQTIKRLVLNRRLCDSYRQKGRKWVERKYDRHKVCNKINKIYEGLF